MSDRKEDIAGATTDVAPTKIAVEGLYKIFGPQPREVLQSVRAGTGKDEILGKTGHTVGLHDVNLDIRERETFVVMGLSGSGKSTFIRCVNRLIEPTAGRIAIDDVDIVGLDKNAIKALRRKKMSMVFQRFALFPHRTVIQNVAYGLNVQGVPKAERLERAHHWIEVVGLQGYERARPSQLSGGMQQRVGLARALCTDPEILLMDEAFSALDPLIRREMQDELLRLQRDLHKTIVFITHDLDEALRLGDRIAILKDGRVVQIGTPVEIITKPADAYVRAFVRDVNRARVLTAGVVMERVTPLSVRTPPREALAKLTRDRQELAFAVDSNRRYQGVVHVTALNAAIRRGDGNLVEVVQESAPTALPAQRLEELLALSADSAVPIVVLDERDCFLGILPRAAILSALAGEVDQDDDLSTEDDAAVGVATTEEITGLPS